MKATAAVSILAAERVGEVWDRLQGVTDPELDESVTEMEFVTHVDVDAQDRVHIQFRLPTYWCAANFAFMMADDMRAVVAGLPWVKGVSVVLGDHMYAETINRGIAQGLSFAAAFGDEADGDLDEVRRTFLLKAFQRRQEAVLLHLTAAGYQAAAFVALQLHELVRLPVDAEGRRLIQRYLERRAVAGPADDDAPAFVTAHGERLDVDGFGAYLTGLRRVRVNAEFNGALCRGLLSARFDPTAPLPAR